MGSNVTESNMPEKNPAALDFLLTRRSRPAKTLTTPVPSREELMPILTAAARTPDHGKLEPWRFIVLERAALARLAEEVELRGAARGEAQERIEKVYRQFADAHLAVAVVSSPKPSEKVPEIEQVYSAGAVCLAMLNAALASGWGANWLSGWPCHDREFLDVALGLAPGENIAGFIHIGSETSAPPERPRPDVDAITTWMAD
jgi:nitroreductase